MNVKRSLSSIIDSILIFVVTAFFAIALCGYFIKGTINILMASVAIAVCVTALISLFKHKKGSLALPEVQNVMNQFVFNNKEFAHLHIKNALEKKHAVSDCGSYLLVGSTMVQVRLFGGKLGVSELIGMFVNAKLKAKKLLILTIDGADKASLALIPSLPEIEVHILDGEAVYRLLKSLDSLPEIKFVLKKSKLKFREIAKGAVTPSKARGYFLTAFVLILSSFFLKMSIYYLIFASICLTMGVISVLDVVSRIHKNDSV